MFTDPINQIDDNFEERFKESLDNSFMIFTGQKTYNEILLDRKNSHFFFFDPEIIPTREDVLDLLHIYEEYEEYEKCGELYNLINQF